MNLITETTLAKQLNVSRKTVYRQRMAGNIPFIKFGGSVRFQADIVHRLLQPIPELKLEMNFPRQPECAKLKARPAFGRGC